MSVMTAGRTLGSIEIIAPCLAATLAVSSHARASYASIGQKPPRAGGTVIVDEGDGGVKLAEFLISNKLV